MFTATAVSHGAWGNQLALTVSAGTVAPASNKIPTFTLVVKLNGVEVERWNEVSTDPTSNRYLDAVINNYSKYIDVVTTSTAKTANAAWAFFTNDVTPAGGSEGSAIASADYTTAINKLDVVDAPLIMNAPGVSGASNATITTLISKAESRGNSFVVIDPTNDSSATTIGASVVGSYPASSYAAVYYPMLKMVDPTKTGPGAVRTTYPGGAVVGAYIRSEVARTVAKAPAGYSLDVRNALGLATAFTPAETGTLYDTYGVNTFKAIPGGGIVINGTRTLDRNTPGKYITIRRSLNFLKQSLKDVTAFAVFEPNDEQLWTSLSLRCSSVLSEFWRAGGLKGNNTQQAFYVVCDSSNNTVESIAQGQVNIEVGVALQYPAEFVVLNISQWTGGSSAVSSL
jgi:phage tail sheath protein FI